MYTHSMISINNTGWVEQAVAITLLFTNNPLSSVNKYCPQLLCSGWSMMCFSMYALGRIVIHKIGSRELHLLKLSAQLRVYAAPNPKLHTHYRCVREAHCQLTRRPFVSQSDQRSLSSKIACGGYYRAIAQYRESTLITNSRACCWRPR